MSTRFPSSRSDAVSDRSSRWTSTEASSPADRSQVAPPAESPADDLSDEIKKIIRARWQMGDAIDQYSDYQMLARDYLHDITLLRDAVHQFKTLIIGAWRLNTEFSSLGEFNAEVRDRVMRRREEQFKASLDRHLIPPQPKLEANLEAIPLGLAFSELRSALDGGLSQFVRGVGRLMDELVKTNVVGEIEWATPTACDLHYYRTLIVQQTQETRIVHGEEKVIGIRPLSFGYAEQLRQEISKLSKGMHLIHRHRYDLYLTKARNTRVQDGHVMIPKGIAAYFDSLPPWVQEIARVVDGKQLRRTLSVEKVSVENWEDTRVVYVNERERLCGCPVISLGNYVLIGWGDEEDSRELARRSSAGLRSAAILMQLFAVTLFCLGQLLHPGFSIAAAVVSALGLVGFVESRRQAAVARSETASVASLGLTGLLWAVFWIAAMALAGGLVASKTILLMFGTVALSIGLGILRLVIKAQHGPEESDNRVKS